MKKIWVNESNILNVKRVRRFISLAKGHVTLWSYTRADNGLTNSFHSAQQLRYALRNEMNYPQAEATVSKLEGES